MRLRCPAVCRAARLLLHILSGLVQALAVFPWLSEARRWARVRAWAGKLLAILGVRLRIVGLLPETGAGGMLLVANHVSWLDIHLIHAVLPARFVSKAEIRGWPLIGRLAEAAGTVFLERRRRADAARVNALMMQHLEAGDCLAFFPEGTTSDGQALLPFYHSLFQPAVSAGMAVHPVLIRYCQPDGGINRAVAYYGEMSLMQSLRAVLAQGEIEAELHCLPALPSTGLDRRALARSTEALMRQSLQQAWAGAGPGTPPETGARPPA